MQEKGKEFPQKGRRSYARNIPVCTAEVTELAEEEPIELLCALCVLCGEMINASPLSG
jgi:hypothetical protein